MRGIAGYVIDHYDDFSGEILAAKIPSIEQVPDFIKTAHQLTNEERASLPDHGYALILLDHGQKMRKFAMVDAGNTALSVMYLLEQGHLLPPEAVKVAAVNLMNACEHYGIAIPEKLKTAANLGFGVAGKGQDLYRKGAKVIKVNFDPNQRPDDSGYTQNSQLGKDEEDEDLKSRANLDSPQGTNFTKLPTFSQKEKTKDDSAGEGSEKTAGAFGDAEGEVRRRERTWNGGSYLDVTGWQPGKVSADPPPEPAETLLRGHYPVDTYDQTKTASDYFLESWKDFAPRDRHTYCVKLAARMAELNMEVPDIIGRYGSETYAADVDDLVRGRSSLLSEEYRPHIETLIEKRAHVQPDTFAEALADFDETTGLKFHYGSHVVDPWYATFGPSHEKLAADKWVYDGPSIRIDENQLKHLARNGGPLLKKSFGEEWTKKFRDNPKKVFEGLDGKGKQTIGRLTMDFSGSGEY